MNASSSRTSYFNDYYYKKLKGHASSSAEAVGWSEYLQQRLFDSLAQVISEKDHFSILDVGSGLGHLTGYLAEQGYCTYDYTGIDIVEEMIKKAEGLYPNQLFMKGDFLHFSFFRTYDYIFCSGALNILTDHRYKSQEAFITAFIKKLYSLSDRACAFNLLSVHTRELFPENRNFYYADPDFIEKICSRICDNITIIKDEHDYTFTVLMKRQSPAIGKLTEEEKQLL